MPEQPIERKLAAILAADIAGCMAPIAPKSTAPNECPVSGAALRIRA